MPGKRPAKNGPGGKGLQVASSLSVLVDFAAEFVADEVDLEVLVADVELAEPDVVELVLPVSPGKLPTNLAFSFSMVQTKLSSRFEQL